jgi:FkbM family methyltransferase
MTLGYVWREQVFAADCVDRVVLDLGAHKGYFATWALAHGAAHVYSFEPESANFERLERAQAVNERSERWSVRRAAVGEKNGSASLFVSAESWAHSLQDGMVEAVGVERVDVLAMESVLQEIEAKHPDSEVVVKMNVEGSVGSIVLPLDQDRLRQVVEIHLDHEPGSPYDIGAVLDHLSGAGLGHVDRPSEKIYVARRTADLVA